MKRLIDNQFFRDKKAQTLLRILLGGLFVYAGILKLVNTDDFEKAVAGFRLIPDAVRTITTTVLPWLEVIVGAMLVSGLMIRTSTSTLSLLLVLFIIVITVTLIQGDYNGCGCFSSISGNESLFDGIIVVGRDLVFLAMGGLILAFNKE